MLNISTGAGFWETDLALFFGGSLVIVCIMAPIIIISKNKKFREKIAVKRAEREERRAAKKRMK